MEKILVIRENDFKRKKDAMEFIAENLEFPDYFGGNLDALFDCLIDIEEKTNIAIDPIFDDESSEWYMSLFDTIVDAALDNENIHLYFPAITEEKGEDYEEE